MDLRTATPHFPGIGRYAASLANALPAQLADDEELLLLEPSQGTWPFAVADAENVRRQHLAVSPFDFTQQWKMRSLLRRLTNMPTIYHSLYFLMPYWPGVPAVWTFHDLIPLLFPQMTTARTRIVFRIATSLALRTAAATIAVSQASKSDLVSHYGVAPERVSVAPHGVDARFHPQPLDSAADLRARLDLPTEFILYVGSNKPHKNLPALVAAYAQLGPGAPPLVIAGAWDDRYPESRQVADQLVAPWAIRFVGAIADGDLPTLYSAATAFVFPSRYEGFGLPVLEAMACGTPVACSNVSSLPEVAGDAALLFDPDDRAAIGESMQRLLDDAALRTELRERGLAQAARFTWEKTAAATLAVYRKLSH